MTKPTPRALRTAAANLRQADHLLDRLNYPDGPKSDSVDGWSLLIGFDLDFLAKNFDDQADHMEGRRNRHSD